MSELSNDLIAAIATPPGQGGVGIIRLSGPLAGIEHIAEQMVGGLSAARHAAFRHFLDADQTVLDEGVVIYFPAPHSFTGEHVLELQGHGGPVVLDMVLQRVVNLGARLAKPGEFSERAFLNDKLDLAQAEAIADLIASSSQQAVRAAQRSLQGDFSRHVSSLVEQLIQLRLFIEAAIDFPDEDDVDFIGESDTEERLVALIAESAQLQRDAQQGQLLRDGMTVVLAGQPNVGKSSLLNALAGQETAIVTNIPGTTRDVLRERITIDGMPLHIIDTAGLRESDDAVEQEGIRRARKEIETADCLLLLVDEEHGPGEEERALLSTLPEGLPVTIVHNKIDKSDTPPSLLENEVFLSAKAGIGVDLLRSHLKEKVGFQSGEQGNFLARRRHLDALERAHAHAESALEQLRHSQLGELIAEDLRQAQLACNEITGEFTSDDLLGRIFSSFCIGK